MTWMFLLSKDRGLKPKASKKGLSSWPRASQLKGTVKHKKKDLNVYIHGIILFSPVWQEYTQPELREQRWRKALSRHGKGGERPSELFRSLWKQQLRLLGGKQGREAASGTHGAVLEWNSPRIPMQSVQQADRLGERERASLWDLFPLTPLQDNVCCSS